MEKPVKKWARNEENKVFLAYQNGGFQVLRHTFVVTNFVFDGVNLKL
jgi:hypothetical protein